MKDTERGGNQDDKDSHAWLQYLMGMEVGGLRMPLTELSEAHTMQLKKAMQEFGIQLA